MTMPARTPAAGSRKPAADDLLAAGVGTPHPSGVTTLARPENRGRATHSRRKPRVNLLLWLSIGWLALVVLAAVLADLLPLRPYNIAVPDLPPRTPPRFSLMEPLGTDSLGRSVTTRLIRGARQSLIASTLATVFAMTIGLALGTVAGYFRRMVDSAISVVIDTLLALPGILLLLAIASVGQRNMTTLVAGLTLIGIPSFTRLARANTIALSGREFVSAAIAMGASHARVLVREIIPTVVLRLSTPALLFMAVVIVLEASLSFLGLGVPPPNPSWGGMVNAARPQLASDPYLVFVPAACIVVTVASFQIVGDRLRRRLQSAGSAEL